MNNLIGELKQFTNSNPLKEFTYHLNMKKNGDLSSQYNSFLSLYNQYAYLGQFLGNVKHENKMTSPSSRNSFHINQLCPELFADDMSTKVSSIYFLSLYYSFQLKMIE